MKKSIKKTGAVILLTVSLVLNASYAVQAEDGGGAHSSAAAQDDDKADGGVTAPSEQKIYARGAVLMDALSGRVLYEKNGNEKMSNASTTKIMTCILFLEQRIPEDEVVEISSYAASQPKVHLGMLSGEQYRAGDLLYSMMLESHNDSAAALAEHMGRNYLSEDQDISPENAVLLFADAMNRKAKEIGCENTCFVTPNGLDSARIRETDHGKEEVTHGTSARDLALIMAYCVEKSPMKDQFTQITQTGQYRFSDADGKRSFTCMNRNAFLSMMDGVISGKTGFTAKAGYCYVAALERDGKCYTLALLGCGWPNNKTYKWKDSKTLFSYGIDAYEKHTLEECGEKPHVTDIPVLCGQGQGIGVTAYTDAVVDTEKWESLERAVLLPKGQSLRMQVFAPEYLEAPVVSGMKVGEIRIYAGNVLWQECPLFARDDVNRIDQEWCVRQIFHRFLLFTDKITGEFW